MLMQFFSGGQIDEQRPQGFRKEFVMYYMHDSIIFSMEVIINSLMQHVEEILSKLHHNDIFIRST
jgi:hypothetical protein